MHRVLSRRPGGRARGAAGFLPQCARSRLGAASSRDIAARCVIRKAWPMKPTMQIANEWRALVRFPYPWRACPNQAGTLGDVATGEAGGLFVDCEQLPSRRAYMKPRVRDARVEYRRAAREKICADLAHDLGISVPPVVLADRADAGEEERLVSVSLVMRPAQWSWGTVRGRLHQETPATKLILAAMRGAAAGAFAFDTWVGQTDHGDHAHNIVFAYDPAVPEDASFLFLDFSFSLGVGGAWQREGFRICPAAAFPPKMRDVLDSGALRATVEAIEAFEPAVIEAVVGRVPDEYLPPSERDLIRLALIERRSLLRNALSQHLATEGRP